MAEDKKFINELHDSSKHILIDERKSNGFIIRSYIHNFPPEETEKRRQAIAKKVVKILEEYAI